MYGGIENLFDPDSWIVAGLWVWIGVGLLFVMVARTSMASRVRGEMHDATRMRKYELVRAYFVVYGLDANSGVFLAGAAMMVTGFLGLYRMHQALGV